MPPEPQLSWGVAGCRPLAVPALSGREPFAGDCRRVESEQPHSTATDPAEPTDLGECAGKKGGGTHPA